MVDIIKCSHCREEIEGEPIDKKGRLYCCEACAFEASKKIGSICGSQESLEVSLRFSRQLLEK